MRRRIVLWRVFVLYGVILVFASLTFLFSPTVWSITPKPEKTGFDGYAVTPHSGVFANKTIPSINLTTTLRSNVSIAVGSPIQTLLVFRTSSQYDQFATLNSVTFQFDSKNISLRHNGTAWVGQTVAIYNQSGQWKAKFSGVGTALYPDGLIKYYRVNGTLSPNVSIAQSAYSWQTDAWALSLTFGFATIVVWVVFHNRVKIRTIH